MNKYQIIEDKNWSALEQRFDWVQDMNHVPQHRIHHAEGNVAVHTQLVIEGLSSVEGYNDLTNLEKEILWTAALLHDVEKRSTSVDYGHGIISAKGHAEKGEFTARTVLYRDIPTPFAIREQVASLVRLHGLPLWFLDSPDSDKNIKAASLRVDTRLLAILSESDAKGRFCEDPKILIETIAKFKQRCKELNCWGKPYEFRDNDERFNYFHSQLSLQHTDTVHTIPDVFILISLPYTNRENYIKKHFSHLPIIRLKESISSLDRNLIEDIESQTSVYFDRKQSFVWNGSNTNLNIRESLINYLALKGYRINIVYIEQSYNDWLTYAKQKNSAFSLDDADKYLSRLQMPQLTEAHRITYEVE